jgi:hypothetical protein
LLVALIFERKERRGEERRGGKRKKEGLVQDLAETSNRVR